MAASSNNSKRNGHQCEFLTQPSKELLCKSCEHVARDLTMTVCCCQHFCHECITPLQKDSKPCPGCGEQNFGIVPHVRHRKSITALEVSCTMKKRGCNWTGKLEDLASHTDDKNDNCQYVDVECPKCAHSVPRCDRELHLEELCPKRSYNCCHCGFTATYEEICNVHYLECALKEVKCPNSCREDTIKQGMLQEHLKTCQFQQIECEVPGCNGKFLREDSEKHKENNACKHISLLSAAMQLTSADLRSKLLEQDLLSKERETELTRELEKRDHENAVLKVELQQSKAEIKTLQKEIVKLSENFEKHVRVFSQQSRLQAGDSPHHFTIFNFEHRRRYDVTWHSPPMYVSNGPKISLSVRPNGSLGTNARCTHISVALYAMVGEMDDQINWPIRCTITVELRNQLNSQNHYRIRRGFQWERQKGRKTVGHFGNHPNEHQFISHAGLEWNPQKQTKYLKDNILHLVVISIEPHSQIYLHGSDRQRFNSMTGTSDHS